MHIRKAKEDYNKRALRAVYYLSREIFFQCEKRLVVSIEDERDRLIWKKNGEFNTNVMKSLTSIS